MDKMTAIAAPRNGKRIYLSLFRKFAGKACIPYLDLRSYARSGRQRRSTGKSTPILIASYVLVHKKDKSNRMSARGHQEIGKPAPPLSDYLFGI
ncbi:hypothetical protein [Rhodocyclus purpureus]|uniref:hypothetical protein n=1 Tax=Rhodocyclus purpureus TaxID=1067 RepID=UPI0019138EF1|nr:hypothetical protein [Rhodocyclus purpureus]